MTLTADAGRSGSAPDRAPSDEARTLEFWSLRLSANLLDESLRTPLYHQIYLIVRDLIRQGDFDAETLLPGEQTLAGLFAVSRVTVKRALNELAADKLVSRHRGRGTIVTARVRLPIVRSSFDNLLESLQQMGLATEIEWLETRDVRAADAGVAGRMDLPPGAMLQRTVRRRMLEGEPLSYLINYTPTEIAAHFSTEDLANTSFIELLARAGSAPIGAEQWITAVSAEPRIAAALDVGASTPLLKIERIMRAADGAAVQLTHGFYRPDRFQYHVRNAEFTHTAASPTFPDEAPDRPRDRYDRGAGTWPPRRLGF